MNTNQIARLRAATIALLTAAATTTLVAQEFSNHTYQAVSGNYTWHQARADAESRGGHLATITSQAELDYVRDLGVLPSVPYWLGATDEAQEGTWVWVTGELWSFSLWSPGEPNNQGPEDYLTAAASANHSWNDWGTAASSLPFYLLEFEHCTPHAARAIGQLVNGFLVGATITDSGCGYTNAPVVLIQGGGGRGATATAVVADGRVTAINITSAGCCYTNLPKIAIGSPPGRAKSFL